MVEVEYVGIEDVQDIMDDVLALMREGHYASVQLSELLGDAHVIVYIMLGGFSDSKKFDYEFTFNLTDDKRDVDRMNKCKHTLKCLLTGEELWA